jgi:hypothetical protein
MNRFEYLSGRPVINASELNAFLRNTGWRMQQSRREGVCIFRKEYDGQTEELLLPLEMGWADYAQRIEEAAAKVAALEGSPLDTLLTELTLPPSDTIRFRIVSPDTEGGTIAFAHAVQVLESAKQALYTSASDLLQPETYHRRLSFQRAQQLIDACRLGQTERGSFVTSIICPFLELEGQDQVSHLSLFNRTTEFQESFTRKVTTRLMQSMARVKRMIDLGEHEQILGLSGEETISGNFIESLCGMLGDREGVEVEVQAQWSRMAPQLLAIPPSVKLNRNHFPVLQYLRSRMRPSIAVREVQHVGRISHMQADPDAESRQGGEITLSFLAENAHKIVKAQVQLGREDYSLALFAHGAGKLVRVTGRLVTNGRIKRIESPRFEIIPDSE